MRLDMVGYGGSDVLAGALNGRTAFNRMLEVTMEEPENPELIILDFSGVVVATASFLRESVLAFRDVIRRRRSQLYPIVANLNEFVRDEFVDLLESRGDALMTCSVSDSGGVRDAAPLGVLDPKQRLTFDLVRQHGETDAGALMRQYGESERVKYTTAWNNRLAALAALGLIIEQSQGRSKRYRPLVEEG